MSDVIAEGRTQKQSRVKGRERHTLTGDLGEASGLRQFQKGRGYQSFGIRGDRTKLNYKSLCRRRGDFQGKKIGQSIA